MRSDTQGTRAGSVARVIAVVLSGGFLAAAVAIPLVLESGPVRVGIGQTAVRVDALAVILSALVVGLSALIQTFAIRYLRGDARQGWFVGSATLLTGVTVVMVCAGSVAVFAVGWVGAGAALVLLLATYRPLEQARQGVRATVIRFAIADTAFFAAVILVLLAAQGDVSWERLGEVLRTLPLPVQLLIAGLLVAAALGRSAQIPFHGWLPVTLAAPTPVSALMHAGVVNAGGILLLRFAPAIAPHTTAMTVVFLAGAATLVFAAAARLVRPDVKGRLVFSTMGQMGFMIMTCGLGLYAAAIFHLVAHSLFKSALFLGAGTGVTQHTITRDLPLPRPRSRATVTAAVGIAVVVPAGTLLAAKLVLSPTASTATVGLLAFVSLTATVALASALLTHLTPRTVALGVGVTVVLAAGYVAFLGAFTTALQPPLPVSGASGWLLLLPAVALLVVQFLARNPRRFVRIRDIIYARSLTVSVSRPRSVRGVM